MHATFEVNDVFWLFDFCVAYTRCVAVEWFGRIYLFMDLFLYVFVHEIQAPVTWALGSLGTRLCHTNLYAWSLAVFSGHRITG